MERAAKAARVVIMIELDLIREHLRIDTDEVSDALLTMYLNGAIRHFETRANRKLFADAIPGDAPDNALLIDEDIQVAILLLINHRNENRGVVSDVAVHEIPMGAKQTIDLHRWFYG